MSSRTCKVSPRRFNARRGFSATVSLKLTVTLKLTVSLKVTSAHAYLPATYLLLIFTTTSLSIAIR